MKWLIIPWLLWSYRHHPVDLATRSLRGLYLQVGIDPLGIPLTFTRSVGELGYHTVEAAARMEYLMAKRRTGAIAKLASLHDQLFYYAAELAELQNGRLMLAEFALRHPEMHKMAPPGMLERMARA